MFSRDEIAGMLKRFGEVQEICRKEDIAGEGLVTMLAAAIVAAEVIAREIRPSDARQSGAKK